MQSVLPGGVVQGGGGGDRRVGVQVQVGGAWECALRRGARRLLGADEVVVVVMVVMVQVVVAVGVGGGVPQGQDVPAAGRQRGLGGGQVGAGAPQGGGLPPRQRGQDHGVAVEQRGGCSLQDELSALDTLILITLRGNTQSLMCNMQYALIFTY